VPVPIDARLVKALHLEVLRRQDLHSETDPDVVFQTSTIGALLDGAYDGDVTFGELRRHGDLGLGTFDACDGEMIALEGSFYRAAIDGRVHPVPDDGRTPFAVITFFAPTVEVAVEGPMGHEQLLQLLERSRDRRDASAAVRVDGRFDRVQARSVARQSKPYRPLVEVVRDQRVFEFEELDGTLVGFRFPDYAQGVEVPGYHLHFISADRARGGHVLDCRISSGRAYVAPSSEMHLELPPGVDLTSAASSDALDRVERSDESRGAPRS
jgi:acetolactate decarboxylase